MYNIILYMEKKITKNNNDNMSIFLEKCQENNLKITPQRIAIYKELIRSKDHPSADVIYRKLTRKFPNISLDTVNRTLITFAEIGIAGIVEGSGSPKRFDPNMVNHHHFRCTKCGTIIDFRYELYDNIEIPEEIQRQTTILTKRVVLEGYCNNCDKIRLL